MVAELVGVAVGVHLADQVAEEVVGIGDRAAGRVEDPRQLLEWLTSIPISNRASYSLKRSFHRIKPSIAIYRDSTAHTRSP
jgi:hypothetical protein